MLPNAASALIDPAKVRDYLLSPSHPTGRFKAAVFAALGYTQEAWPLLRDDLLQHGKTGTARLAAANEHGQPYVVSGTLIGPNGRTGTFVTVWLVRPEASVPRFVTAYPE